jgi:nitroimidazol reductase NimA-like FMN-containing flavoprotein (pyridoxamine 5'-phosphate oxidase superfamily)
MTYMEIDRNGLEVLGRDECLRLLGTAALGRLALTSGALPTILPVNFWFDGERILILTAAGSKLDAAMHGAIVAFEVDDFDPLYHHGWSVVVTGEAMTVTDADEVASARAGRLSRWAPSGDAKVIAISTDLVSGRWLGARTARLQEALS